MKSEKGFTGIDIAIAVIILFIFISLIAVLSYNINSSSKEMELKTEAINLAVEEIEKLKNKPFNNLISELESEGVKCGNSEETASLQEIKEGFYRKIIIMDYHDIDNAKLPDIVKKVTVQIEYKFKAKDQKVELSTLLSKEN